MLVTAMFYTRVEMGQRIGWTLQCNGIATVISGFAAYGVAHTSPSTTRGISAPWQLLMLVYAGLMLLVGACFAVAFPDSPVTARFLAPADRAHAVARIRGNQSGVETKAWKRAQVVEALRDGRTWLFFLLAVISYVYRSLSFGFHPLLGSVSGVVVVSGGLGKTDR
jgi:MFS transporter, ACS family, allantoate permease